MMVNGIKEWTKCKKIVDQRLIQVWECLSIIVLSLMSNLILARETSA